MGGPVACSVVFDLTKGLWAGKAVEGRRAMKRIMTAGMAMILAVSLTACGGSETVREEKTTVAKDTEETKDTGINNAEKTDTPAANSNKVKKNPYTENIKLAYIAHDLSTPNNQAWLEGIERECASWNNIVIQAFNGESSAETQEIGRAHV